MRRRRTLGPRFARPLAAFSVLGVFALRVVGPAPESSSAARFLGAVGGASAAASGGVRGADLRMSVRVGGEREGGRRRGGRGRTCEWAGEFIERAGRGRSKRGGGDDLGETARGPMTTCARPRPESEGPDGREPSPARRPPSSLSPRSAPFVRPYDITRLPTTRRWRPRSATRTNGRRSVDVHYLPVAQWPGTSLSLNPSC